MSENEATNPIELEVAKELARLRGELESRSRAIDILAQHIGWLGRVVDQAARVGLEAGDAVKAAREEVNAAMNLCIERREEANSARRAYVELWDQMDRAVESGRDEVDEVLAVAKVLADKWRMDEPGWQRSEEEEARNQIHVEFCERKSAKNAYLSLFDRLKEILERIGTPMEKLDQIYSLVTEQQWEIDKWRTPPDSATPTSKG